MKKSLLFFCLFWLSVSCAVAQKIQIGPRLGYGWFQFNGFAQVDRFIAYTDNYIEESNHIGAFARFFFSRNRFYIQPELTYGDESESVGTHNTNPQKYVVLIDGQPLVVDGQVVMANEGTESGQTIPNRVIKTSMITGANLWQPLKWLGFRGFAGFSLDYRFDNFYRVTPNIDIYATDNVEFDYSKFTDGLNNSYHHYILNGLAGIGIDIWKINFDVSYAHNLTPLNGPIVFKGKSYAYPSHTAQLLYSLGAVITLKGGKKKKK